MGALENAEAKMCNTLKTAKISKARTTYYKCLFFVSNLNFLTTLTFASTFSDFLLQSIFH